MVRKMNGMKMRRKLFNTAKPFDTRKTEMRFVRAMRENCRFQYENCPAYRKICDSFRFRPGELKRPEDLGRLPFIPTVNFKRHKLFSVPEERQLLQATSSGTSGRYSTIGFVFGDLWCGLKMVLKIGRWRGLFSLRPTHYIVMGYKPHRGNRTAVTKTAFGATLFSPALSRTYALKYSKQKQAYEADLEGVITALKKFAAPRAIGGRGGVSGFPVRFMGFPSYTYFMLRQMEERGLHLKLPQGSKIMLGGGWKQFYKEQVDKEELYRLAKKTLDVDEENIIEFFGAVEHPILYCDCERHHFHVPVYGRVLIRDVDTLKPVPIGQTGLVNLLTPMVKATPILSVMTDDLGVLHEGRECGCGLDAPYLEIIGRVGLKDIKTCAAGAVELLDEDTATKS